MDEREEDWKPLSPKSDLSLSDQRKEIIRLLKRDFVPLLREHGFSGSHPNFRRLKGKQFDFIFVQFNKYGGSFAIELGYCSPEQADMISAEFQIDNKKITVGHLYFKQRFRLGALSNNEDRWFTYNLYYNYSACVNEAIELFKTQAESWWKNPDKNMGQ